MPGVLSVVLFVDPSPNLQRIWYGEAPPQTVGVNDTGTPNVGVVVMKLAKSGREPPAGGLDWIAVTGVACVGPGAGETIGVEA
jgi:hypothetical protein